MKKDLHPLVMIALVAGVTLFGRVLPTWTLSLATIAASNARIALGIVVLARTGTRYAIDVNMQPVRQAGVQLSSKLLRLARTVRE